jgi:hypothetical protein
VIGGAFGIGGGGVKVPKAVAFAIGDELGAVFLRFALVHESAIQGSGGEPAAIFIAHRFRGSHLRCSSCQFVGLPDVFQCFTVLEDQSRVKIIIGHGQHIAFLAVYAVGKLNGKFALWAGLLDAATGFSAPFAAHYLTPPRTAKQRGLLMAWMAVGILDFVVAIPLAARVRVGDPASMVALTIPPLSLITTYFVPLALMDYVILAVQLWRQRRSA